MTPPHDFEFQLGKNKTLKGRGWRGLSSVAFRAQSPGLRFASMMDMDFAVGGPLVRRLRLVPDVCPSTRTFAIRFLQTSPRGDIHSCKRFALGSIARPIRQRPTTFGVSNCIESGASICNRNRIMTGVRFMFRATLRRHDLAAEV
jgi:hypothetical protein